MKPFVLLLIVLAGLGVFVHFWTRASKDRRDVLARIDREESLRPGYSPTAELFREVGAPPLPEPHTGLAPLATPEDPFAAPAGSAAAPAPAPTVAPATPPAPQAFPAPAPAASFAAPTGAFAAPAPAAPTAVASAPAAVPALPVAPIVTPAITPPSAFAPQRQGTAPIADDHSHAHSHGDIPAAFAAIDLAFDYVPVEPGSPQRAVFAVERSAAAVRAELDDVLARLGAAAIWHEPTVATVSVGAHSGLVTIYPNAGTVRDLDGRALFATARSDETVVRFSAT